MSVKELKVVEFTCDVCGDNMVRAVTRLAELPEDWQMVTKITRKGKAGHPPAFKTYHFCSRTCRGVWEPKDQ